MGERNHEKEKLARSFTYEQGLAFFVVNFNYSKEEYDALTDREKLFIYKAYETKIVSETTHMRNAVMNAVANAMRKKGKKPYELFTKKQEKVDVEFTENALEVIQDIESTEGKSWVDLIYVKNGMRKPTQKGG